MEKNYKEIFIKLTNHIPFRNQSHNGILVSKLVKRNSSYFLKRRRRRKILEREFRDGIEHLPRTKRDLVTHGSTPWKRAEFNENGRDIEERRHQLSNRGIGGRIREGAYLLWCPPPIPIRIEIEEGCYYGNFYRGGWWSNGDNFDENYPRHDKRGGGKEKKREEKRISMDSFVKSKGEKFVEFVFSLFSNLIRFDLIFFRSSFYDSLNWKKNFFFF